MTVTQLEQIAAAVESDITSTRIRLNELAREGAAAFHAPDGTVSIGAALGKVHGALMAADRVVRQEIERLSQGTASDAGLITIRARGVKSAVAQLIQQSQEDAR